MSEKFSGWRVVGGCFIIMFVIQGGMQTFAVFLPSIVADTGFSLVEISLISSFACVFAFFSNMLFGRVLKKFGLKITVIIGIVCYSVHFYIFALANSLLVFYAGAIIGGFVIGFSTVAACSVVLTNWFVEKRALMISIAFSGSMFGGAIIMYLLGLLIDLYGWRMTYVIQGTVLGLMALIAILFLIIEAPDRKGQLPYGTDKAAEANVKTNQEQQAEQGIEVSKAKRTPCFFLMLAGLLLVGIATNIENYLPAFWQSMGMGVVDSAKMMAVYAFLAGIAAIILGKISDKMGAKIYTLLTLVLFVAGCLAVYFVGIIATAPMLGALLVFALGGKKTSNLVPPQVTVACFGRKDYCLLIGSAQAMLQLGIAVSNPIIGKLYAVGENYFLPFMVMAVLAIAALLLIQASLRFAPYQSKKF